MPNSNIPVLIVFLLIPAFMLSFAHQMGLVLEMITPNTLGVQYSKVYLRYAMQQNRLIRRQFGQRLIRLRRKYKLTQEQLAERAGCTDKYIQMLEGKNPSKVSIDVLKGISDAFGMPLWKLLKF